ncbi:glycosyltransferase family 2 protein [Leeuwenhoekiella parthenopeia]|uniref:Glycosyltransferase n=1 Tax=Leeuwenhoekiella parthenopeia TaxID=2890320 RepID=A0ABS8GSR5_9FLAO|nr:glycosyltransferase family 2 protein [Leeuwenhoekiella parthenopeia]MCC4212176.1 glycosyltransferase [Leeuwenhoekiella parthenopeia]
MAIKKPINAPLISIVTPCCNSAAYIEATVKSIQNQSITDWELLLVDDGSTDATLEIISKLAEADARISYFKQPENLGPALARNRGIELAQGSYLTFIDADDLWFPRFLERSLEATKDHAFVFSSYQRLDENLQPYLSDFIVPKRVSYTDILKSNSISCLTAFIDISQLGKKYMPLIKKRQDMGLWLQYLKETGYAYGIQEPLAVYRIRKGSLSRNKAALLNYQWQFYREFANLNPLQSAYYMACWAYNGFVKYRN